jgi:4-alpha-glucanotransferase
MTLSKMELPTLQDRSAGILLHPTSLPGRFGIGDLGPAAFKFIDFLEKAGQRWWQMLPIGPTGVGNSPYQPFSAFAGNPLLISLEVLRTRGLLTNEDLAEAPGFTATKVDYAKVAKFKQKLLETAFSRFRQSLKGNTEFQEFEEDNKAWLNDHALFAALHGLQKAHLWTEWPGPLRKREKAVITQVRKDLHDAWLYHKFLQFEFHRQWTRLRSYAEEKGIALIGDLPIYVSLDSADVWSHPELYRLNPDASPKVVAGVPPDLFSKNGQRWGNPVYNWAALKDQDYGWWVQRFKRLFDLFDVVRLDHFIGFYRYWEIPSDEETAVKGRYVPGPGADFFKEVMRKLPRAAFIAEDLGVVVPQVTALREQFHLPGMNVLQFAFGGDPAENPYLPYKYVRNSAVYTGTHDNDTLAGWFNAASESEQLAVRDYIGKSSGPIHWELIRLAYASVSNLALVPLQDFLGLGSDARMNFPGKIEGNWVWRTTTDSTTDELAEQIKKYTQLYGRIAKSAEI